MGLSGTGEFEVAEPGGGDKTSGIDARGDKTSGPDAGGNEPAEADKRGLKKAEQKQRRREPVRSGKRNGKGRKRESRDYRFCNTCGRSMAACAGNDLAACAASF